MLLEFVCQSCKAYLRSPELACPHCHTALIYDGPEKNIIDELEPNCLIHRYPGSDLLEPAQIIKEGKVNMKVAVKLKDLQKPIAVPKSEVYSLDQTVLSAINALRSERRETMDRFDDRIGEHWSRLSAYHADATY